jgi:CO/xanthine dehydrogenase Mo-binding subunit
MCTGDVDAAWDQCAVIVEGEFTTEPQAHVSMEPCGALAEMDAQGRVTLWSANQSVFRVQANVCESLKLPMSRLRSLTPRVGAGFGNKMEPHVQPLTVALAMKTGRPVKCVLTREEDFEIVRARLSAFASRPAQMPKGISSRAMSRCCLTAGPLPTTARVFWAIRC